MLASKVDSSTSLPMTPQPSSSPPNKRVVSHSLDYGYSSLVSSMNSENILATVLVLIATVVYVAVSTLISLALRVSVLVRATSLGPTSAKSSGISRRV